MTDRNLKNTAIQDEELLEAGDDELSLESGEDTLALESGDDLAAQALEEANTAVVPGTSPKVNEALGATLMSLQNVIERNVNQLDEIKQKLKEYNESMKNIFENDQALAEAEEQASVITSKLKERKTQLQGDGQVIQLKNHIVELREQKKEIEEALNNHFLNLYQITGTKTFDTSSGEQREFSIRASVKGGKKAAA